MSNIDASQNNKSKRSNRIYSDLDLDFNRNTVTNDIPKVEDVNAVKRSVRNLVQTNYYERPFHPELGCGIRELLFEPYTPIVGIFLRRKIGIVFQDFQLLTDRSVHDNLEFVLKATGWKNKNDIKARIEEVLNKVEMLDKINSMPFELSGGEQQRVSIARAFVNEPEILFADEPTGNLDDNTGSRIEALLFDLNKEKNTTLVLVTHDLELAGKTSRIIKLRGGKVISDSSQMQAV